MAKSPKPPASRTRRAPPKGAAPDVVDGGPRRITTSLVLLPWQLTLLRQVANLRALKGRTHAGEDGVERRYSMSAVIFEIIDQYVPQLEKELLDAGQTLPSRDA